MYILRVLLVFAFVPTATTAAQADVTRAFPDYIKGAKIEANELDIQYQYVTSKDSPRNSKDKTALKRNNKAKQHLEAYYGLSDEWVIIGGAKFYRDYKNPTDFSHLYTGAGYQFLHQKQHGVDMSFIAKYEHAVDNFSPDALETRLLLDVYWDSAKKVKTKSNFSAFREFGNNRSDSVELVSRVSTTYKVDSTFSPGVEWHAGYGLANDVESSADQAHFVGPVIYGEFPPFSNGHELEYQIGYFKGVSGGAAESAFKFFLEYEINF